MEFADPRSTNAPVVADKSCEHDRGDADLGVSAGGDDPANRTLRCSAWDSNPARWP
jgi:hypothetical protein